MKLKVQHFLREFAKGHAFHLKSNLWQQETGNASTCCEQHHATITVRFLFFRFRIWQGMEPLACESNTGINRTFAEVLFVVSVLAILYHLYTAQWGKMILGTVRDGSIKFYMV